MTVYILNCHCYLHNKCRSNTCSNNRNFLILGFLLLCFLRILKNNLGQRLSRKPVNKGSHRNYVKGCIMDHTDYKTYFKKQFNFKFRIYKVFATQKLNSKS